VISLAINLAVIGLLVYFAVPRHKDRDCLLIGHQHHVFQCEISRIAASKFCIQQIDE